MKKWYKVTYRLSNPIGPINKTEYTDEIHSETDENLLIENVINHLYKTEVAIPVPEIVESLNDDGTKTMVLSNKNFDKTSFVSERSKERYIQIHKKYPNF